jgi:hypothetical protein
MLVETIHQGRVVIDELHDRTWHCGADAMHGMHVERRGDGHHAGIRLEPVSDQALLREIERWQRRQ